MPRQGQLEITKDAQSGKWVVNISARISKTGKRARRKFSTKAQAESHRKALAATLASPRLKRFDETLLEAANYYDEAFQLYGYQGLADACADWIKELDDRNRSQTLGDVIKEYQSTRGSEWSGGYLDTFRWAKKQLEPLSNKLLSELDARHWQVWLPVWRKEGKFSAGSFNHLRTFLVSLFSTPLAASVFPSNPARSIPRAKVKRKQVIIASNAETRALMNRAWNEDPEMVPWFAIAFFAGLRPDSELKNLDWSNVNFGENWIRVEFGNKTDTKRFVDLAPNLALWLRPFQQASGPILQTNHRNRKAVITEGILTWARDITRHTYGSNLEAQARADGRDVKSTVITNMGHNSSQTYEQHYRNARTAKEAKEFWTIAPVP